MTPEIIACFIGGLAAFGCVCAVLASLQIRKEKGYLDQLEKFVNNPGEWVKVYAESARDWLAMAGLPLESHAANLLVAVRGGWAGGKLPTVGELHAVIVRRERSRSLVRLAGGIAATLLIFGIAGTLLGIHPLLTGFKIASGADGTVQEASESARDVMSLVSGLGRAFLPSLAALMGTLGVVTCRGWYVLRANQLARRLDVFAADILMPAFRLPTQDEVMAGVKESMAALTHRLEERDLRFAEAVKALENLTGRLEERTPALEEAISSVARASEGLAVSTESVTRALDRNFGQDSASTKSLLVIEELGRKISVIFGALVESTSELNNAATSASRKLSRSAEKLSASAKELPAELKAGVEEITAAPVGALKKAAEDLDDSRVHLSYELEQGLMRVSQQISADAMKISDSLADHSQAIAAESSSLVGRMAERMDSSIESCADRLEPLLIRLESTGSSIAEKAANVPNGPPPLPPPMDVPRPLFPRTLP